MCVLPVMLVLYVFVLFVSLMSVSFLSIPDDALVIII